MSSNGTASAEVDATSANGQGPEQQGQAKGPGLLDEVKSLVSTFRALVADHARVAALETRQAGESLVMIIAMGLIIVFLLFSAWLALLGILVLLLTQFTGLPLVVALLLVVLVQGVVAAGLAFAIRKQSRNLLFPTMVKNLKPATEPPSPDAPSGGINE